MPFQRATERAHDLVRDRVRPGDSVIDATAGNGHDTRFLAELVGPSGRVIGFDIQPEAIGSTRKRLEEAGVSDRVDLRLAGHESIEMLEGAFKAVMFNLGYLPGGDKSIITRPGTTIPAIEAALERLAPGGLLTVVIYPGHAGGAEEANAVLRFCESLSQDEFAVIREGSVNQANRPPSLVAIEKR